MQCGQIFGFRDCSDRDRCSQGQQSRRKPHTTHLPPSWHKTTRLASTLLVRQLTWFKICGVEPGGSQIDAYDVVVGKGKMCNGEKEEDSARFRKCYSKWPGN